jgi:hypothetical protein
VCGQRVLELGRWRWRWRRWLWIGTIHVVREQEGAAAAGAA